MSYDFAPEEKRKNIPYLDNKLGIMTKAEMDEVEYKITAIKALTLLESGKLDKMDISLKTFCYIHKVLFEELYPWAGEIRTVNMQKGYSSFYPYDFLPQGLQDFFDNLKKDNFLKGLTKEEFVELFAYYNNELNVLHPFREGNGRARRLFLTEIAKRAGWDIDLTKMDSNLLREADIKAFGNIQKQLAPNMAPLKNLINNSIKPNIRLVSAQKPKTIEQQINRMLWVYDRERYNCWCQSNINFKAGEEKVKELLKTKSGRDNLIRLLAGTTRGAKTEKYKTMCNKMILKIKELNSQLEAKDKNTTNNNQNGYEL